MVLEKTFESLLDCKDIQPVHPKGDQSWVFIGRTDVEAETPKLWPPDVKSWLIGKDPDAGKYWMQEEKGTTEDEMVGWHHQLSGHGFGWTQGVGDGQGGLVCCTPWGSKRLDSTEWLNWTEKKGGNAETKEKQVRNNSAVVKEVLDISSRDMHIFEIFVRNKGPTPNKEWQLQAEYKIPGAPPSCCLTTNQSEESHMPYGCHPKFFL